jgi:metal-responsive CopG/Arc/MetJ family transcriptional regulator
MSQDAILQMRIAADLVAELDELRRHESDIPSRSEMVRRLISRAAEAQQKREIRSKR